MIDQFPNHLIRNIAVDIYCIPMNFAAWHGMDTWREFKGNLIAPEGVINYDNEMGATWRT